MSARVLDGDNFEIVKFDSDKDIELVASSPQVQASQIVFYKSVPDITKVFQDLVNVGDLLGLAMAAAGHHSCTKTILTVQCSYKQMIGDSSITSAAFVSTCLRACKALKLSYKLTQKAIKEPEKARYDLVEKHIKACGEAAGAMAKEVSPLIDQARALITATEVAMQETMSDTRASSEERQKVGDVLKKLAADKKEQEEKHKAREAFLADHLQAMGKLQSDLDKQSKAVLEETRKLEEHANAHANALAQGQEEYFKKLEEAQDEDHQEWLIQKQEIEKKRDDKIREDKEKLREKEAAKKEREAARAAAEAEAAAYEHELKQSQRDHEINMSKHRAKIQAKFKKQDILVQAKTAATAAHAECQTKCTNLRQTIAECQEKVRACESNVKLGKLELEEAKNAGWFKKDPNKVKMLEEKVITLESAEKAALSALGDSKDQLEEAETERKGASSQEQQAQSDLEKHVESPDPAEPVPTRVPKPTPVTTAIEEEEEGFGARLINIISAVAGRDEFEIPPEPRVGKHAQRVIDAKEREVARLERELRVKEEAVHTVIAQQKQLEEAKRQELREKSTEVGQHEAHIVDLKGDIARKLEEIGNATSKTDSLTKAIQGLELALKNLGNIVNAFDGVKLFWQAVQKHCENIHLDSQGGAMESLVVLEDGEAILGEIDTLMKQWAILGMKNVQARDAICAAHANVSDFFDHIPNETERPQYIADKVAKLQILLTASLDHEANRLQICDFDEDTS